MYGCHYFWCSDEPYAAAVWFSIKNYYIKNRQYDEYECNAKRAGRYGVWKKLSGRSAWTVCSTWWYFRCFCVDRRKSVSDWALGRWDWFHPNLWGIQSAVYRKSGTDTDLSGKRMSAGSCTDTGWDMQVEGRRGAGDLQAAAREEDRRSISFKKYSRCIDRRAAGDGKQCKIRRIFVLFYRTVSLFAGLFPIGPDNCGIGWTHSCGGARCGNRNRIYGKYAAAFRERIHFARADGYFLPYERNFCEVRTAAYDCIGDAGIKNAGIGSWKSLSTADPFRKSL